MRSLTFVLPASNEARNIGHAVKECLRALEAAALPGEVVVVDDGSTDPTGERARSLGARVVRHERRRGYGAALRSGFAASRCEYVCFTDADLQFDVAELPRLVAALAGADLVCGYRSPRRDPAQRRLMGWAWSRAVNLAFDVRVQDVNCAFKLLPRAWLASLELRSEGAFVNGELLARARAAGLRIAEVPVSHRSRRSGRNSGGDLGVAIRAWGELLRLRRELRAGA
jgi:glycosyltransferase involved in cell wall biosynthesis